MSRLYVPLNHYFDPAAGRLVPREWMGGINRNFRFNRRPPTCIAANMEPTDVEALVWNTVRWEELLEDSDGMFSKEVSPTQLTVKTTGWWMINWSVQYDVVGTATNFQAARLIRNRLTIVVQTAIPENTILIQGIQRLIPLWLEAGEFVEIDLWGSSTTNTFTTYPPFYLGMFFVANPDLEALP